MRLVRAISKDLEELERARSQAGFMISQRQPLALASSRHSSYSRPLRKTTSVCGEDSASAAEFCSEEKSRRCAASNPAGPD